MVKKQYEKGGETGESDTTNAVFTGICFVITERDKTEL